MHEQNYNYLILVTQNIAIILNNSRVLWKAEVTTHRNNWTKATKATLSLNLVRHPHLIRELILKYL